MGGLMKIFSPVTQLLGSLLGMPEAGAPPVINIPPVPEAPKVEPPKPMPTPNSQDVKAAQRKSVAEQLKRRGRASTILTADSGDTLG